MFQRSSQLRKQSRGERENRCLTQPERWHHPVIAQLVEHLTVALCSDQMVPGSIPGDRMLYTMRRLCKKWNYERKVSGQPAHDHGGRRGMLSLF